MDGTYWILQDGHLAWVKKFCDMEVLGLLLLELNMWKIKCAENFQEVDILGVEVTGWKFLDLPRLINRSVQKYHKMEVLGIELYRTSSLKEYHKHIGFIS